jgi:hypothetical protein
MEEISRVINPIQYFAIAVEKYNAKSHRTLLSADREKQ